MTLYERTAFVIVEANSLEEAEEAFERLNGHTDAQDNVSVSLDDSPAYEIED